MNLITAGRLEDTTKFLEFCKNASQDIDQPAAENMWHKEWNNNPHTLPFLLFKGFRFSPPNGEFFIIEDQGSIVGCSGIYTSEFSKDIAIAGCRTWITKEYRNKSLPREYLLPAQKEWAKKNNCKAIALTFNDYNKNIINTWKRIRAGERRSPRQPYHIFHNNFNEVEFPVTIQYTPQWVIYEILDNSFNFDWQTLKLTNAQK